MLNFSTLIRRLILKALHGGSYAYWHVAKDGSRKVFWCDTLEDAMEWMSCSLRDDRAMVLDHNGYFIAQRDAY